MNVFKVTSYNSNLSDNDKISLDVKLAILPRPSRSSDQYNVDLRYVYENSMKCYEI